MTAKYRNNYKTSSQRLRAWNYSSDGWYFITICVKNRMPVFGEIVNRNMDPSRIGKTVEDHWHRIPVYYPNILLDEFVIMPNHIHGIIQIQHSVEGIMMRLYKKQGL